MRSHSLPYLLLSGLLSLLFLTVAHAANACTCGPRPTVLGAFDSSDEVVIARLASVKKATAVAEERHDYLNDVAAIAFGRLAKAMLATKYFFI